MQPDTRTRFYITALVALMIASVVFGIGAVAVLSIPALAEDAAVLLPLVVVVSFVLAPFISWAIAPRLRSRWQRRQSAKQAAAAAASHGNDYGYRAMR